jgi:uncharacterized protein YqgC (DUF456 family)
MGETSRNVCGIALIIVGLVAIPVPVIPGVPLIAAGVALVGADHPMIRSCRTWLREKGLSK